MHQKTLADIKLQSNSDGGNYMDTDAESEDDEMDSDTETQEEEESDDEQTQEEQTQEDEEDDDIETQQEDTEETFVTQPDNYGPQQSNANKKGLRLCGLCNERAGHYAITCPRKRELLEQRRLAEQQRGQQKMETKGKRICGTCGEIAGHKIGRASCRERVCLYV